MLPLSAQEDSDKKQPRPRPNQDVHANNVKAEENDMPKDTTKKHGNDADYEDLQAPTPVIPPSPNT